MSECYGVRLAESTRLGRESPLLYCLSEERQEAGRLVGILDLKVITEFMNDCFLGQQVVRAEAPKLRILCSILADSLIDDEGGRRAGRITPQGKNSLPPFETDRLMAQNEILGRASQRDSRACMYARWAWA